MKINIFLVLHWLYPLTVKVYESLTWEGKKSILSIIDKDLQTFHSIKATNWCNILLAVFTSLSHNKIHVFKLCHPDILGHKFVGQKFLRDLKSFKMLVFIKVGFFERL